jgi:hypothetical protein
MDLTTLSPLASHEPSPADLAELEADFGDLDDLLAESTLLHARASNRRIYKETKIKVDAFLALRQEWRILENIQVWEMTRCDCGHCGTINFVRNMQRKQKVGQAVINICTVEELEPEVRPTMALCTRPVSRCEYCAQLDVERFQDFKEVVK